MIAFEITQIISETNKSGVRHQVTFAKAARGLELAATFNVIYRDMLPDNIKVGNRFLLMRYTGTEDVPSTFGDGGIGGGGAGGMGMSPRERMG